MAPPKTPLCTVDVIIQLPGERIVLIKRKNPPHGWALPGGFVDVGEPLHVAAVREAKEETGLTVELSEQFFTYSDPSRDPRGHTVSSVYLGTADGVPRGADDAEDAQVFALGSLPPDLAFDHGAILRDFVEYKRTGKRRKI